MISIGPPDEIFISTAGPAGVGPRGPEISLLIFTRR